MLRPELQRHSLRSTLCLYPHLRRVASKPVSDEKNLNENWVAAMRASTQFGKAIGTLFGAKHPN